MEVDRCPGECQELLGSCCSFLVMHIKTKKKKNVIYLDNLEIARLQNKELSVHFSKLSLVFSHVCISTHVFTCMFIYVNMCVGTCLHPEGMYSVSPNSHICLHDYARNSILKIKCRRPTASFF